MKKRLFCLALLFMMVFTFAACDTDYTPPDFGEKGYAEHFYRGIHYNNSEAPKQELITSTNELKQYRKTVQFGDDVTWDDGYTGSRETVYTQLMAQLDSYSSRYFRDNVLVALIRTEPSGSNSYTVKSVTAQESNLNVTLQRWLPTIGTTDIQSWCVLIECPKGDYTDLKVEVKDKYQVEEVKGTSFRVSFTHEASLATVYHDYTPADFPELDFEFTIKDDLQTVTDFVRNALLEEPIDSQAQYRIDIYVRLFEFTLAEKSKENVLRAVELLSQREEIEFIYPTYEYLWEED